MAVLSGLHLQFFYILRIWVEESTDLIQVDDLFLIYMPGDKDIKHLFKLANITK